MGVTREGKTEGLEDEGEDIGFGKTEKREKEEEEERKNKNLSINSTIYNCTSRYIQT